MYVNMKYNGTDDHKGDPARLNSPLITAPTDAGICVRFWYHMHGQDMNEFRVYYKQRDSFSDYVWSRKNSQGTYWILGEVNNGKKL